MSGPKSDALADRVEHEVEQAAVAAEKAVKAAARRDAAKKAPAKKAK